MRKKDCGKQPNVQKVRIGIGCVGRGLIATRLIRAGDVILTIRGKRMSSDAVWEADRKLASNCLRLSAWTYLDPLDGPGRFLNHSCSPNAALLKSGRRLKIVAVRDIPREDEVSIDYSTNLGFDDIWTMRCRCGSKDCRRVVKDVGRLPDSVRNDYVARGLIPEFILRTRRFVRLRARK